MINFLLQHQFWAAVAVYWIFSAAVDSLPAPASNASAVYAWLYRFLHTMAGNISRIPALKTLVPLLLLIVAGCAAHYTVHPGALNTTDSAAYDTLLVAKTAIDTARADHQSSPELNKLITSYNLARDAWFTYRGALMTQQPSDLYFQQLNTNLTDLITAIRETQGKGGETMNNLILELVDLVIEIAQQQVDHGDVADTLLDIVHKAADAYEEHTGEALNTDLIGAEEPL